MVLKSTRSMRKIPPKGDNKNSTLWKRLGKQKIFTTLLGAIICRRKSSNEKMIKGNNNNNNRKRKVI